MFPRTDNMVYSPSSLHFLYFSSSTFPLDLHRGTRLDWLQARNVSTGLQRDSERPEPFVLGPTWTSQVTEGRMSP